MNSKKIKLKYTRFQMVLEFLSLLFLVSVFLYVILQWDSIPQNIPRHYNGEGVVDSWGRKSGIWSGPIIGLIAYTLLTVISFFPRIWNVPVQITDSNRDFVYSNMKSLLLVMKNEVSLAFFYMTYSTATLSPIGAWFLPVLFISFFGTLIYYVVKVRKAK